MSSSSFLSVQPSRCRAQRAARSLPRLSGGQDRTGPSSCRGTACEHPCPNSHYPAKAAGPRAPTSLPTEIPARTERLFPLAQHLQVLLVPLRKETAHAAPLPAPPVPLTAHPGQGRHKTLPSPPLSFSSAPPSASS